MLWLGSKLLTVCRLSGVGHLEHIGTWLGESPVSMGVRWKRGVDREVVLSGVHENLAWATEITGEPHTERRPFRHGNRLDVQLNDAVLVVLVIEFLGVIARPDNVAFLSLRKQESLFTDRAHEIEAWVAMVLRAGDHCIVVYRKDDVVKLAVGQP